MIPHKLRVSIWILLSLILYGFIRSSGELSLTGNILPLFQGHNDDTSIKVIDSVSVRSEAFSFLINDSESSVSPVIDSNTAIFTSAVVSAAHSDAEEGENNIVHADFFRNQSILSISDLLSGRRAQFHKASVNQAFLSDMARLHGELTNNYTPSSRCRRVTYRSINLECFGLGTSMIKIATKLARITMRKRSVVSDIDTFGCNKWFERDQTRNCSTMFGDCYFPALSKRSPTNFTGCHKINWFPRKYGEPAMVASFMSWMLGDYLEHHEEEPCVALHIRRGDACINEDRKCFDYDTYYQAVKAFIDQDSSLQRIIVLTDAHDFPLQQFETLVGEVTYSQEVNRSKYIVDHLKNESIEVWTPENREIGNAASELLSEVSEAQKCAVLVGTLTAGISKWLMNSMLTRLGRVPQFYSLQGCLKNSWTPSDFGDDGCESILL